MGHRPPRSLDWRWLLLSGILALFVAMPRTVDAELYGTIQVSDKVDSCEKTRNHVERYRQRALGQSTHQPLAVSFCNLGAYSVKSSRLVMWRKDGTEQGDGWWNQVFNEKIDAHIAINDGVYWTGLVLEKGESYKFELTYNIAAGDKESCTTKLDSASQGMLWEVASTGSTTMYNRCRKLDKKP